MLTRIEKNKTYLKPLLKISVKSKNKQYIQFTYLQVLSFKMSFIYQYY